MNPQLRSITSLVVAQILLSVCVGATVAQDSAAALQHAFEEAVAAGKVLGAQIEAGNAHVATTSMQFGHVNGKQDVEVNDDTMFFVGSVTKPLTTTCVMRLAESGTIGLEDPAEKWLPGVLSRKTKDGQDLVRSPTIRELASHRSGLYPNSEFSTHGISKKNTRLWAVRDLSISLEESVKRVGKHPFSCQPGTTHAYSCAGFDTLGRCIEIADNRPFDEVFVREVCKPLGMKHTTFLPGEFGDSVALPRTSLKGAFALSLYPPSSPHNMIDLPRRVSPGSGIYSTARDLGKFARMMLNRGGVDGKPYISEDSWKQLTSKPAGDFVYELGWKRQIRKGRVTAISHGGTVHGCKAHLRIDLKNATYQVALFTLAFNSETKVPWPIEAATKHKAGRFLGAIFDGERKVEGLIVKEVTKTSPADQAGLKPGDRVIEMNGQEFTANVPANQVKQAIEGADDGLSVIVLRDGEKLELTVVFE